MSPADQIRAAIAELTAAHVKHQWKTTDTAWHRRFGEIAGLYRALWIIEAPPAGAIISKDEKAAS